MDIYARQWPADALSFHADVSATVLARESVDAGLRVSNVGGWHSSPDLLTWVGPGVADLVDRLEADAALACGTGWRMQAWANVMRAGAHHLAHRHGDATWSGVYYIATGGSDAGGRITFARGLESRVIAPVAGLMLIFPGDLLHSVETYVGQAPRISVAFNLFR